MRAQAPNRVERKFWEILGTPYLIQVEASVEEYEKHELTLTVQ